MIHAYDKSYLSAAQKNLARMLDYLVNDLHYPLETAWQWFVTSELSARFEQGDCSVLVGLSGVELARAVLEQAGEVVSMQKPSYAYDRSPEYWTGWALAYYQWLTGLRFAEIEQAVSITKVRLLYYALPRDGCTAVCRQDERVVPCGKAGNKPESHAHIGRIEPIGTGRTG